jgi:hypothetical protein
MYYRRMEQSDYTDAVGVRLRAGRTASYSQRLLSGFDAPVVISWTLY